MIIVIMDHVRTMSGNIVVMASGKRAVRILPLVNSLAPLPPFPPPHTSWNEAEQVSIRCALI